MDVLRNIRTINGSVDYTVTESEAWSAGSAARIGDI
jgi:hypothetical protein